MLTTTVSEEKVRAPAPARYPPAAAAGFSGNEALCGSVEVASWQVLQSDITSALSYALDLTEDAVPGHAVRSCLLAMCIGKAADLSPVELRDLFYTTLLKDVGCSSNASRLREMLRAEVDVPDSSGNLQDTGTSFSDAFKPFQSHMLHRPGLHKRGLKGEGIGRTGRRRQETDASTLQVRCERGAAILRKLGLGERCAEAVCSMDECWDGTGHPHQRSGKQIPSLARIISLAQRLDMYEGEFGREEAIEYLRRHSGRDFDPELVAVTVRLHSAGELWTDGTAAMKREVLMAREPGTVAVLSETEVDGILEAFADVIDAKSAFTYKHSLGVTTAATGIGRHLGLPEWSVRNLYRAALVHDIGKLGVSNRILDKPGKLDPDEWQIMREHPRHTHDILSRIPAFAEIALTAGRHHERLDGSGYPNQLRGEQLTLHDRILAVADVYGALAEDRPYRKGLPSTKIVDLMSEDVPNKLDERCFGALISYMQEVKPFVVAA